MHRRNKEGLLANCRSIILQTVNNGDVQTHWNKYRAEYPYAANIDFGKIVSALSKLFTWAGIELSIVHKELDGSILSKVNKIKKTINTEAVAKKDIPSITKKQRTQERDICN